MCIYYIYIYIYIYICIYSGPEHPPARSMDEQSQVSRASRDPSIAFSNIFARPFVRKSWSKARSCAPARPMEQVLAAISPALAEPSKLKRLFWAPLRSRKCSSGFDGLEFSRVFTICFELSRFLMFSKVFLVSSSSLVFICFPRFSRFPEAGGLELPRAFFSFDLLMEEPQNRHFHDFETFERVPEPQKQLFYLWRPQDASHNSKKSRIVFENIIIYKFQNCGNRKCLKCW